MILEVEIKWEKEFYEKFSWAKIWWAITKSIYKTLIFLESKAIPETPIRTWNLRKWYNEKTFTDWGKLYNDVEYAWYVHNWTRFIKANPFLERTAEKNIDRIEAVFNKEFLNVLNFM